jgi:hypothetical protein
MKTRVFTVYAIIFLFCGIVNAGINDGLVAYYPFNGNANDESGNGNNGVVHGATLTSDRFGNANNAYSFNGIDHYVVTNQIRSFFSDESLTISVWFKVDISGIIVTETENATGCYGAWCSDIIRVLDSGMVTIHVEPLQHVNIGVVTFGVWHNVVIRYNGNTAKLDGFIDGMLSTNDATGNRNSPVALGRDLYYLFGDLNSGWGYGHFGGSIDDIRIYNRALSASEVQQIYQGSTCSIGVVRFTAGTPAKAADVNANFDALNCQIQALKAIVCKNEPTASVCQ